MSTVSGISSLEEMEGTLRAAQRQAKFFPTLENLTYYHDLLIAWKRQEWVIDRLIKLLQGIQAPMAFPYSFSITGLANYDSNLTIVNKEALKGHYKTRYEGNFGQVNFPKKNIFLVGISFLHSIDDPWNAKASQGLDWRLMIWDQVSGSWNRMALCHSFKETPTYDSDTGYYRLYTQLEFNTSILVDEVFGLRFEMYNYSGYAINVDTHMRWVCFDK